MVLTRKQMSNNGLIPGTGRWLKNRFVTQTIPLMYVLKVTENTVRFRLCKMDLKTKKALPHTRKVGTRAWSSSSNLFRVVLHPEHPTAVKRAQRRKPVSPKYQA